MIRENAHLLWEAETCSGETKEQYLFLKEIDCEQVQGFYFYKPKTLEKVISGGAGRVESIAPSETQTERTRLNDLWLAGEE